jgi:hypothetical protein
MKLVTGILARFRAVFVAALAIALVGFVPGTHTAAQQQPESSLPEVDGWALAAPMLAPSSEQAVAELGGKIYTIGGYPPGRIPVNVVQVYDVATNRWEYGPPLPVAMHHAMAIGVGDTLYVIGGEFEGAGTGRPEVYLDTVYALDPREGVWTPRSPMPTGRLARSADPA